MAKQVDAKLDAVLKSLRAEENQVLAEREKIRSVLLERSEAFSVVRDQMERLEAKRIGLEKENRSRASTSSEALNLSRVSSYLKRLATEVSELREEYEEKYTAQKRASDRLDDANEEILRLQLEMKRVQSILTSRGTEERYRKQATEDVQVEESNHFRKRRN